MNLFMAGRAVDIRGFRWRGRTQIRSTKRSLRFRRGGTRRNREEKERARKCTALKVYAKKRKKVTKVEGSAIKIPRDIFQNIERRSRNVCGGISGKLSSPFVRRVFPDKSIPWSGFAFICMSRG